VVLLDKLAVLEGNYSLGFGYKQSFVGLLDKLAVPEENYSPLESDSAPVDILDKAALAVASV